MRLAATIASLDEATGLVRRCAQECGLTDDALGRIEMILEELLVNIALYAYPADAPGFLELDCAPAGQGKLQMEIADQGQPFNPLDQAPPDLEAPLAQRRSGGLGIFLVKEWSESAHYRRENGWNRLQITFSAR